MPVVHLLTTALQLAQQCGTLKWDVSEEHGLTDGLLSHNGYDRGRRKVRDIVYTCVAHSACSTRIRQSAHKASSDSQVIDSSLKEIPCKMWAT